MSGIMALQIGDSRRDLRDDEGLYDQMALCWNPAWTGSRKQENADPGHLEVAP